MVRTLILNNLDSIGSGCARAFPPKKQTLAIKISAMLIGVKPFLRLELTFVDHRKLQRASLLEARWLFVVSP